MAFTLGVHGKAYPLADITLSPTAGSLLIAWITGSATAATTSVSGGGTWVALPEVFYSTSHGRMCYCLSAAGGSTAFHVNNPPASDPGWLIKEITGANTWALDTHLEGTGLATTFSSGAITTAHAHEILIGSEGNEAGSQGSFDSPWADVDNNTTHWDLFADREVNIIGSYSATGTFSGTNLWVAAIAAFYDSNPSSSGGPFPHFIRRVLNGGLLTLGLKG